MATTNEKVQQHGRLLDRNKAILDRCEKEDREPTAGEHDEWSANTAMIKALDAELNKGVGRKTNAQEGLTPQPLGGNGGGMFDPHANGGNWIDPNTRKPVKVYGRGEKMAPGVSHDPCFLGRMMVGIARGNIGSELTPHEIGALAGSTDTAGGFTMTPEMILPMLDAVRSQSVAFRAGVQVFPMNSREARIAFVENDPTTDWAPEQTTGTDDTALTFGAVNLRARTLRVQVPISEEMLMDTANGAEAAQTAMIGAIALGLDRAILFGQQTGDAEEPQGLRHVAGTTESASVGTPANYDKYASAFESCLVNDARETLELVMHPRDRGILDRLKDTTNQPLRPPASWLALEHFTTTSIPITEGGGSDESFALMGPFREIVVGMRLNPQIIVGARSASDLKKYQRTLLAVLRADVAIPIPARFVKLTGITIT